MILLLLLALFGTGKEWQNRDREGETSRKGQRLVLNHQLLQQGHRLCIHYHVLTTQLLGCPTNAFFCVSIMWKQQLDLSWWLPNPGPEGFVLVFFKFGFSWVKHKHGMPLIYIVVSQWDNRPCKSSYKNIISSEEPDSKCHVLPIFIRSNF